MALDDTDQQKPDDTAKSVASSLPLPFGGSPLSPASPVAPPAATAPRSPVAPAPPLTPVQPTPVQPTPAAPQQPRAAAPKPQAPANAAGLIAHFEGFRETPYWDVNHWRVGYGSDTITHPDGTVESVGPNTRVTQADAQRDLQRRTGIYQNMLLTSIGSDAYARIGAPAQNAIASVAYNYGHVPNSVAAAAQTGDPQKVAAAIAALPANPQRRAQEAGSILGTFSAPALAGGGAMQMPAGAANARPAPGADLAGFSSLEQPKAEEKKDDGLAAFRDENARKHEAEDADLAAFRDEGAKKVEEEAGAQGKGFMRRAYDKLTQGLSALAPDPEKEAAIVQSDNATGDAMLRMTAGALPLGDRAVALEQTYLPKALGGTGEGYDENLAAERQSQKKLATEHPIGHLAAEVGGAYLTGSGLEALGGKALSTLGWKAAEAAPEAASWVQKAGQRLGEGVRVGTAGGAAQGLSAAPDWTDGAETAKSTATGAGLGAVGGGLLTAAGLSLKGGYKYLEDLVAAKSSSAPEDLASAVRGKIIPEAEKLAAEERTTLAKTTAEEAERKTDLLFMNEQVKEAQKAAEKAGLTEAEAAKFAAGQRQELEVAKESADKFVASFADRKTATPEEASRALEKAGAEDYAALREARKKEVKFEEAVRSDGGKPSIPTAKIIDEVDALIKSAQTQPLKETAGAFKKTLSTDGQKAVSIQGAREVLEHMNGVLEGMDSGARERLRPLVQKLQEQMETTHPAMKTAREKYRDTSRPLDPYERHGAGARIVDTDLYSKEPVVDMTKLIGAVIRSGEGGAELIGRLANKDAATKEALEKYLNGQFFGFGSDLRTPDPKAFNKLVDNYRLVIEKAGLRDKFTTPAEAYKNVTARVKAAEEASVAAEARRESAVKAAKVAEGAAERTVSYAEETQKAVSKLAENRAAQEKSLELRKQFIADMKSSKTITPPKDVAERARSLAEDLRSSGKITQEQKEVWFEEAAKLDEAFKTREAAEKAWARYRNALVASGIATAVYNASQAIGGHVFLRNVPTPGAH